jgi:mycofactocin precursor peptide peptidase
MLAVPLGATEQHGPHLPLSVDTDLACALVDRLAAARHEIVTMAPICVGSSGEHEGFAGTVSIGQQALESLIVELGRSATRTFDRVLFVSAHGGNAEPLCRAVGRLRRESRDVRAWSPDWGGDAHAGRAETSLMLHLSPERVSSELAVAGDTRPISELLPELRRYGVAKVSPNGVLGDPRGASAPEGQALLERALADLCRLVAAWT